MNKKIIIVLIILLVAGLGYFYLNKNQQSKSTQKGWETYANKELGISFNYPPNFKVYQPDEKTLRVTSDYKNLQHSGIEITLGVTRLATTRETTEQIEARFKPNFYPGMPADLKDKLSKQTYSSQNKGNYNLFRVEDDVKGLYFYLQSNKGTFLVDSSLATWKQKFIYEGVYQNYANQFNQIVDSMRIN